MDVAGRSRHAASGGALLIVGMVVVGANLRPAASSVGPVLDEVREALGLSSLAAGALTSLSPLCFGVLALLAPVLALRVGYSRSTAVAMALLTAGLVVRVAGGTPALFLGTVLAGAGIAIGNVMLPVLVKRSFPNRPGFATGLYAVPMIAVAALAAALTVPLEDLLDGDWRVALGIWAVPAAVAFAVWLPQVRTGIEATGGALDLRASVALLRAPVARHLTLFFGLQAAGFYAILAWLPAVLKDGGVDATTAGALLGISVFMGLPAALVMPTLASRAREQRWHAAGSTSLTAVGLIGLIVAPSSVPLLWVVLLGLGQGSCFPLALTMIVLRSSGVGETAGVSTAVQAVGYLVAATGPLLLGAAETLTGSWSAALCVMLAATLVQIVVGAAAGRDILVGESLRRRIDGAAGGGGAA